MTTIDMCTKIKSSDNILEKFLGVEPIIVIVDGLNRVATWASTAKYTSRVNIGYQYSQIILGQA